ncbi:MAG: hypothetical protein E3J87_07725 [Candidatus Cloacimonadota bacterium]|nr:MAG: hypothetical protein E3J87_07725 [Candidatus Cloacimonadota bacterium]
MAAKAIGEFLLKDAKQRAKLKAIFAELPKKWQKTILIEANRHLRHYTISYSKIECEMGSKELSKTSCTLLSKIEHLPPSP